MTGPGTDYAPLTSHQTAVIHRLVEGCAADARRVRGDVWGLPLYVALIGLVVGIDFSITFSVMRAALPDSPTAMVALKSVTPLLAIGALWVIDLKQAAGSLSSDVIRRAAGVLTPAIPMGIGLFLGFEVFNAAVELLADTDASMLLGEDIRHPAVRIAQDYGTPVFALVLAAVTAGFFTVSTFLGHHCLTEAIRIARTAGRIRGRAAKARHLARVLEACDQEGVRLENRKRRLIETQKDIRPAITAVITEIEDGLRTPERVLTARVLDGARTGRRVVLKSALPDQVSRWSVPALEERIAAIRAKADPAYLRKVFKAFTA
ncbi:hypothetical protein [Rhodospirillum sp. A1_3_36]|uniref:hypothetical protein n=1 Tax=Rhodospirillum sp. A1_3_36 TaxID=3391666 RepID=UPI0039A45BBC